MSIKDVDALVLAELERRRGSAIDRFLDALPVDAQEYARGIYRIQAELAERTQRLYAATDVREAVEHAEWIARNVRDVAFRWTELKRLAVKFAEREPMPRMVIGVDYSFGPDHTGHWCSLHGMFQGECGPCARGER